MNNAQPEDGSSFNPPSPEDCNTGELQAQEDPPVHDTKDCHREDDHFWMEGSWFSMWGMFQQRTLSHFFHCVWGTHDGDGATQIHEEESP